MKFVSNAKYDSPVESGTVFTTNVNGMKITIHRIIHLEGWYLSCYDLGINGRELKAETIRDAIEESKGILKAAVARLEKTVEIFSNDSIEISKY